MAALSTAQSFLPDRLVGCWVSKKKMLLSLTSEGLNGTRSMEV